MSSRESRETKQQVIAGLSARQRTVEKLQESMQSSNERIEELTDKVNALDSDVKLLSRSDHVEEADQSSNGGGRGIKRERTKSSLVVQVSILLFFSYEWQSVLVKIRTI